MSWPVLQLHVTRRPPQVFMWPISQHALIQRFVVTFFLVIDFRRSFCFSTFQISSLLLLSIVWLSRLYNIQERCAHFMLWCFVGQYDRFKLRINQAPKVNESEPVQEHGEHKNLQWATSEGCKPFYYSICTCICTSFIYYNIISFFLKYCPYWPIYICICQSGLHNWIRTS